MIEVLKLKENCVHLKIYNTDNFQDIVQFFKDDNFSFDPIVKSWSIPSALINHELKMLRKAFPDEPIEYPRSVASNVKEEISKSVELRIANPKKEYHHEIMNYDPLPGKAPNETYQMDDFLRALNQNRFLFSWEMGLGKSWALAALITHQRFYNSMYKCLVFSSTIGIWNLKSELLKFSKTLTSDEILVIPSLSSLKKEDRDIFNLGKYPGISIIIMTYDCMKGIEKFYKEKKKKIPFSTWSYKKPMGLFMDECHLINNPKSERTKAFFSIMKNFDYRYEFSGTIADSYEKLYAPYKMMDFSLVYCLPYQLWLSKYNKLGTSWSKWAINKNGWRVQEIEQLNQKVNASYAVDRKIMECLDIKERVEMPIKMLDMSPIQREIYNLFVTERLKALAERERAEVEGNEAKVRNTTQRLMNMFQFFQLAVDNPEVLKTTPQFQEFSPHLQQLITKYDYTKDSTKLEYCKAVTEYFIDELSAPGIIWCYHPATCDALAKAFAKYKPIVITADMDVTTRFKLANEEFKEKGVTNLLISPITLLNTSVTLTNCMWEFYVEKVYNYVAYTQSTGRIHRNGKTQVTYTYSARYNDSIDNLQELNLKTKGETLNSLFAVKKVDGNLLNQLFKMKDVDSKLLLS